MSDQLNRRQFVILGSVAAAGAVLAPNAFAAQPGEANFVSVGYCSNARRVRGRTPLPPVSFRDAKSIGGDGTLLRSGARLRFHDFRAVVGSMHRFAVDVMFATPELEEKVPFHAWSSNVGSRQRKTASPIAFNVPVESVGSIDLRFERQSVGSAIDAMVIPFSVNAAGGSIPLSAGIYAFAFLRPGTSQPDWSFIRPSGLNTSDARASLSLVEESLTGTSPVTFDYLLMTVSDRTE